MRKTTATRTRRKKTCTRRFLHPSCSCTQRLWSSTRTRLLACSFGARKSTTRSRYQVSSGHGLSWAGSSTFAHHGTMRSSVGPFITMTMWQYCWPCTGKRCHRTLWRVVATSLFLIVFRFIVLVNVTSMVQGWEDTCPWETTMEKAGHSPRRT